MRGWKKTTTIDVDNPVLNDLHLTAGTSTPVDGDVATAQEIRSRFLLVRGSYFLDLREGLPLFQEILKKGYVPGRVRQIVRDLLLTHPAIVDVVRVTFDVDRATRQAEITWIARTTTGRIVRSEDFGPVLLGG